MGKTPPLMKNLAFVFGGLTGLGTAYWFAIRPQHLRWGAELAEVNAFWPGDDLVPRPQISATHAVTIQAPPEPGAFVMERRMLLGIKQRAERLG